MQGPVPRRVSVRSWTSRHSRLPHTPSSRSMRLGFPHPHSCTAAGRARRAAQQCCRPHRDSPPWTAASSLDLLRHTISPLRARLLGGRGLIRAVPAVVRAQATAPHLRADDLTPPIESQLVYGMRSKRSPSLMTMVLPSMLTSGPQVPATKMYDNRAVRRFLPMLHIKILGRTKKEPAQRMIGGIVTQVVGYRSRP